MSRTNPVAGDVLRPTAVQIARALGRPDPTDEQQAVIEAPLAPLLVVAGAGSGKTETMAARVVWLVAGGDVRPDEVLGLTFTRKAASELSERVRRRLRRLRSSGLWTPSDADGEADHGDGNGNGDGDGDGDGDHGHPGEVEVSTYHAYAGRLVREHGLRLGVEPESRLLSEAACWQLAAQVVESWDGPMDAVDSKPSTVVSAVLQLAGSCAEHLCAPHEIDDWLARRIAAIELLPYSKKRESGRYAAVGRLLGRLQARRQILPLVEGYRAAKRLGDSLDFGDQLALAAQLATTVDTLVAAERRRHRAVLLDEFQDTSHAQLTMLLALFGAGHGVTAVGDPHQSIYGWRGASAGTLTRFAARFTDLSGQPATTLPLSTSWRNDHAILAVANTVSEPLRDSRSVPVPRLVARPGAADGQVEVRGHRTIEEEAESVATWVATQWWGPAARSGPSDRPGLSDRSGPTTGRTAAVLCRKRSLFPVFEAALTARGLPVEIVGLGGLLSTPEVNDLVATLQVVHDPTRGDQLMRLLTGPAVRLGPRDLVALGSWSRELDRRRSGSPGPSPGPSPRSSPEADALAIIADPVDDASLVEALDELPRPGWRDIEGRSLSSSARRRLVRLASTLRALRSRTALPLAELVDEVERTLRLDIEVAARPGVEAGSARAHLDAFAEVADGFSTGADRPTLGAFLAWLDAAQQHERGLEPGAVTPDINAVQLLTVHAAKGLEWDVVAVPGMVEGVLPARTAKPTFGPDGWELSPAKDVGWLSGLGGIPHALRGDRDALADVRWPLVGTQQDLRDELSRFALAGGEHEMAEERRLAYVAVTRARHALLLTAHVWGDGSLPRLPSRFLTEIAGVDPPLVDLPLDPAEKNPRLVEPVVRAWPFDPLGERRDDVQAGAQRVLAWIERVQQGDGGAVQQGDGGAVQQGDGGAVQQGATPDESWGWEVEVLLAEREARRSRTVLVDLPSHLSASRLVQAAEDPAALALQIRRPVPREPHPATRRGTAFHGWVERHLGGSAMVDVLDLPGAADDGPAPDDQLAALQETFLASEWAQRRVVALEQPIETPVDGTVVRGRIDAVFVRPGGGVDVVDWKTGAPPAGAGARARAVQLAAYRLAWSRLHDVPLAQVGAAFFYLASGQTVRPVDLLDEQGLVALLRGLGDAVADVD